MPILDKEIVRVQIRRAKDFKKEHKVILIELVDEGGVKIVASKIHQLFNDDFMLNATEHEPTKEDYKRVFDELIERFIPSEKIYWIDKLSE